MSPDLAILVMVFYDCICHLINTANSTTEIVNRNEEI